MNILFLCDEYPPGLHGGIGSSTKLLAEQIAALGHKVFVAGLYPSIRLKKREEYTENKVKVFKIPYSETLQPLLKLLSKRHLNRLPAAYIGHQFKAYLSFLNQLIAEHHIDIVEIPDYQESFYNTFSRYYEYQLDVPYVVKTHGSYAYLSYLKKESINADLLKKETTLLHHASGIIAPSQFSKKLVLQLYPLMPEKVKVIYNGVLIEEVHSLAPSMDKSVVFCGSLVKSKGIFDLISAWNLVNAELPDLYLDIFGKYKPSVFQQLQKALTPSARAKVRFHGHVEKELLNTYYANALVTVIPSYFETFGMTAVEAMVFGSPVIFTREATGPELIEDGVTGILVDPRDERAIAMQILQLSRDQVKRKKLADAGQKRVREKFDIRKIAEDHINLYRSML